MKENKTNIDDYKLPKALEELQGLNPFVVSEGFFAQQRVDLEKIVATPKGKALHFSRNFIIGFSIAASVVAILGLSILINDKPAPVVNEKLVANNTDSNHKDTAEQEDIRVVEAYKEQQVGDSLLLHQRLQRKSQELNTNTKKLAIEGGSKSSLPKEINKQNNKYIQEPNGTPNKEVFDNNAPEPVYVYNNTQESKGTEYSTARHSQELASKKLVDLGPDTCGIDEFTLIASKASSKLAYSNWSTGEEGNSITVQQTGWYWVTSSSNKEMLEASTDSIYVRIASAPSSILLKEDFEMCSNESVTLQPLSKNKLYSYTWNHGQVNRNQYSLSKPSAGFHEIQLNASFCGQDASDDIIIDVKNCEISIPNIITPNGDGSNDYFVITGIEAYPGSELIITNRSGKLVFQSQSYHNEWSADGLPEGTYFYILKLSGENSKDQGGLITVLR